MYGNGTFFISRILTLWLEVRQIILFHLLHFYFNQYVNIQRPMYQATTFTILLSSC